MHLVPRRSFWVLACIAVVAVGERAVAQEPNPLLAALPENRALDLGPYVCPSEDPRCWTNTNYSGMVYDATGHRMLVFGGGHVATYRDDIDVFDFATLTWAPAYEPTPCDEMTLENVDYERARWITTNHPISRHSYDLLAMAGDPAELWLLSVVQGRGRGCTNLPTVDEGAPYVIARGTFAAYSFVSRTWRYTETPSVKYHYGAETDPVSGRILLVSRDRISSIDPADGSHTLHAEHSEPDLFGGQGISLVYFPPNDRFYAFVQANHVHGVFEVHFDRDDPAASTVRHLTEVLPPTAPVRDAWAYDSANELIGGGVSDGTFFAFDPRAGVWHERRMESSDPDIAVGTVDGKALAYDPIDNVFVFRTNFASGVRTWAYRWGGEAPVRPREDAGAGGDAGFDAGVDADGGGGGGARADAGAGASGPGASEPEIGGGCGCRATPQDDAGSGAWCIASALLLLASGRVRRRRAAASRAGGW